MGVKHSKDRKDEATEAAFYRVREAAGVWLVPKLELLSAPRL